ncbi:uncharacterized protein LOC143593981 [Bidens hawaiensis]|uniref:uncharacterized protein LOC143593981 n=1 Tax=Bidens hawaiensis TaxID=980011 RepID=UPI00404A1382
MWNLIKKTDKHKREYKIRVNASILATYGLLNGALSFRGNDEFKTSLYRGHFIELLKLFGVTNEEIGKVILSNVSKNNQMMAPSIQKEICNCSVAEVVKKIFDELGDDVFSILVDESRDVSKKEQMDVVLRYVDKFGFVKERFVDLVHVMETTVLSLKKAIDELFAHYNLILSRIRCQGYDGASNMSVVYLIRESQRGRLGLNPEFETGSGQNQELSLARAEDTRWSSHEKMMTRLVSLYPSVIDHILGVTNTLCEALQRKDQDILNAVKLVKTTNDELQTYRLEGFDSLLIDVTSFCEKYDIEMVNMEAVYVDRKI